MGKQRDTKDQSDMPDLGWLYGKPQQAESTADSESKSEREQKAPLPSKWKSWVSFAIIAALSFLVVVYWQPNTLDNLRGASDKPAESGNPDEGADSVEVPVDISASFEACVNLAYSRAAEDVRGEDPAQRLAHISALNSEGEYLAAKQTYNLLRAEYPDCSL